jgi:hypothetical protein
MFVFATETCAVCPLRAQCVRGQCGRTVQVHPQEALLQRARELQASPAFNEARRQRQVVEHRIARLVQLGIRQARYFGRTKTVFQLCLVAAVANLTLLAVASNAVSVTGSEGLDWSLMIPLATLSPSSLLLGFGVVALVIRHSAHLDTLIHPTVPIFRSLTPPSRPGF